jgi:ferritin-like metal-binding protein YciE
LAPNCPERKVPVEEGSEAQDEDGDESVLDLETIGAGFRVERYEIAGYMTAHFAAIAEQQELCSFRFSILSLEQGSAVLVGREGGRGPTRAR